MRKWVASLIFVLFACERQVDIHLAGVTPQPTFHLLNSNDSTWHGQVSMIRSVLDTASAALTNAQITIFDRDTNIVCIVPHVGDGKYVNAFVSPIPNRKYLCRAIVDQEEYWASDTAPGRVKTTFIDSIRTVFRGNQNFFQVRFLLSDPPDTANFYGLQMEKVVRRYTRNGLGEIVDSADIKLPLKIETNEAVLINEPSYPFHIDEVLFSDLGIKGTSRILAFGSLGLFGPSPVPDEKIIGVNIRIRNISRSSFMYLTSLYEHVFYQNNPFAQPVTLNGNMGQTGIFGLMNTRNYYLAF